MAYESFVPMEDFAVETLRKNGRSFNFARLYLSEKQGVRAARLYVFCRYIDDVADDATDIRQAKNELNQIKRQLNNEIAT